MVWDPRTTIFNENLNNTIISREPGASRLIRIKLIHPQHGQEWSLNRRGPWQPVPLLVPAEKDEPGSFKVWFLPYEPNVARHTVLDPRLSTIMITARMNGCTFGVGTSNLRGNTIVSHANKDDAIKNRNTPARVQAQAQKNLIKSAYSELGIRSHKMFEPRDYRNQRGDDPNSIMLFGIYSAREDGDAQGRGKIKNWMLNTFHKESRPKWRFYQHKFDPAEMRIVPVEFAKRIHKLT
jgi:hypothetical protein